MTTNENNLENKKMRKIKKKIAKKHISSSYLFDLLLLAVFISKKSLIISRLALYLTKIKQTARN